jgi:hypothetical protein
MKKILLLTALMFVSSNMVSVQAIDNDNEIARLLDNLSPAEQANLLDTLEARKKTIQPSEKHEESFLTTLYNLGRSALGRSDSTQIQEQATQASNMPLYEKLAALAQMPEVRNYIDRLLGSSSTNQ